MPQAFLPDRHRTDACARGLVSSGADERQAQRLAEIASRSLLLNESPPRQCLRDLYEGQILPPSTPHTGDTAPDPSPSIGNTGAAGRRLSQGRESDAAPSWGDRLYELDINVWHTRPIPSPAGATQAGLSEDRPRRF